MTKQETSRLVYMIATLYPQSFKNTGEDEYARQVSAWATVYDDVDIKDAMLALKFFAQHDKGFPPTPGQLMERVREVRRKREIADMLIKVGQPEMIAYNCGKDFAKEYAAIGTDF